MGIINSVMVWLMKKRIHQIELYKKYPIEVQEELFQKLISFSENTEWGKQYAYHQITSWEDFKKNVPISDYDDLKPYIEKIRSGVQNVLWPSEIKWFAKSSGTTRDKSKYIPVSQEALEECHYKGGKDMLALYCANYPETKLFEGQSFALGGSQQAHEQDFENYYGDLSAIIIENLPFWAELYRSPKREIALLSEWEDKIDKIVKHTVQDNITSIAGIPSWVLLVLQKSIEYTGKKSISEIWPNLECYFHGGVNFQPYQKQIEEIIGKNIHYVNTYNASEGYFAIQDQVDSDDMLLLLDNGVFYEFLPIEEIGKDAPETISLKEVELGKNYAIIISTNAGLWRYMIGDMVCFTSLTPFRIRITGRTKSFINICGEEIIVDNTDKALKLACEKTNAIPKEYTAAPYFMEGDQKIGHQWVIEFTKEPESLSEFELILDKELQSLNSDYEAKRYKNLILQPLKITKAPKGTFYEWMRKKNRLGGQNKVPRLSNDRKIVEELLSEIENAKN